MISRQGPAFNVFISHAMGISDRCWDMGLWYSSKRSELETKYGSNQHVAGIEICRAG